LAHRQVGEAMSQNHVLKTWPAFFEAWTRANPEHPFSQQEGILP
jgi:hypothetical protein